MLLIRLTPKTYLSSQLLVYYPYMYPFMTMPVHFHILILINRQDLPVIVYTALQHPVYLHASLSSNHKDLPVTTTTCIHAHRPTGSLTYRFILFYSNKPFVLTCPLTCCSKYSQIYLSINRFHLCFLFSIWLYMHTYLSTHLLDSVPTDPPENKCTCLFWCFWL